MGPLEKQVETGKPTDHPIRSKEGFSQPRRLNSDAPVGAESECKQATGQVQGAERRRDNHVNRCREGKVELFM